MTTDSMNEVRRGALLLAQGRQILSKYFPNLSSEQIDMIALVAGMPDENGVEDVSLPEARATANIDRTVAGRLAVSQGSRPSIRRACIRILKEQGGEMSGDAIFTEIEKRGWLPNGKDPKKNVKHALSTYKDTFLRGETRGTYHLADNVPEPTVETVEVEKTKKTAAPAKRTLKTPAVVKDATPRIVEMLKHTRSAFSIPDIAEATKIQNHRQVNALIMTLLKKEAVTRLDEKSESGKSLFKVNRDAFNKFAANQAN